jgi:hypothetical protein
MSLSLLLTFIGLVCCQFELIQMKLKNVNHDFFIFLFLGVYKLNVSYGHPVPGGYK